MPASSSTIVAEPNQRQFQLFLRLIRLWLHTGIRRADVRDDYRGGEARSAPLGTLHGWSRIARGFGRR